MGAGDTKLSFDPNNPAERIRAARIVRDMLRRGYALLVETEVKGERIFTRALDFDETKCQYIIADFDPTGSPYQAPTYGNEPQQAQANPAQGTDATAAAPARRGRPPGRKSVAADSVRSVAVAPSAGG